MKFHLIRTELKLNIQLNVELVRNIQEKQFNKCVKDWKKVVVKTLF